MISVAEAVTHCLGLASPLPAQRHALMEALGLVLAKEIRSEIDSPPFDKALMDGFAVNSGDIEPGKDYAILEVVTAGQVPTHSLSPGNVTQIMTGAPIPAGADAVIRIEDADVKNSRVGFRGKVSPGQSVLKRGASMKVGETVLPAGRLLRPQELGVLAELGHAEVSVHPRPRVAVLATGDELVEIAQTPQSGQIRNSNETMLCGQIQRAGGIPKPLGIARDERSHLAEKIQQGLSAEILILSGGVSAGTRDLVPSELANVGVREVFHKVNVKPGKPVWFGVKDDGDSTCLVFGLPGNPVSSMVCFELFTRPVIEQLMGFASPRSREVPAELLSDFENRGDRPVYHPAVLENREGRATLKLVPWMGSADLRATAEANAMAVFPEGDRTYPAGTLLDGIPWD